MTELARSGSESGSVPKCHGSATLHICIEAQRQVLADIHDLYVPEEQHEHNGNEEEPHGRLQGGQHPLSLVLFLVVVFLQLIKNNKIISL
jgi:hypothetical protein